MIPVTGELNNQYESSARSTGMKFKKEDHNSTLFLNLALLTQSNFTNKVTTEMEIHQAKLSQFLLLFWLYKPRSW